MAHWKNTDEPSSGSEVASATSAPGNKTSKGHPRRIESWGLFCDKLPCLAFSVESFTNLLGVSVTSCTEDLPCLKKLPFSLLEIVCCSMALLPPAWLGQSPNIL